MKSLAACAEDSVNVSFNPPSVDVQPTATPGRASVTVAVESLTTVVPVASSSRVCTQPSSALVTRRAPSACSGTLSTAGPASVTNAAPAAAGTDPVACSPAGTSVVSIAASSPSLSVKFIGADPSTVRNDPSASTKVLECAVRRPTSSPSGAGSSAGRDPLARVTPGSLATGWLAGCTCAGDPAGCCAAAGGTATALAISPAHTPTAQRRTHVRAATTTTPPPAPPGDHCP